jgi:hypothetical protein
MKLRTDLSKWSIVAACVVLVLLGTILFVTLPSGDGPQYRAEALVTVRPFNNTLLQPAFERQIRRSTPGIIKVQFQLSTWSETNLKGTTKETNGVIRLVAAGHTMAEAERRATEAASGVCARLKELYGTSANLLHRVHGTPRSAIHEHSRFRLRLGSAGPGPFPTGGPVYFPSQGISLDPGSGWMRHYSLGREPAGDLVLTGEGDFNGASIHAFSLGPTSTNVESTVAHVRPQLLQQRGIIESSLKEEPFTSVSGLHGKHVSFTRQYPGRGPVRGGMMVMTQTEHDYIVTNAQLRCVEISYVTVSGSESEGVQRMIRSTLKAE